MLQATDLTIRLNAADDVVIARVELPAGTTLVKEANVAVATRVPAGHPAGGLCMPYAVLLEQSPSGASSPTAHAGSPIVTSR